MALRLSRRASASGAARQGVAGAVGVALLVRAAADRFLDYLSHGDVGVPWSGRSAPPTCRRGACRSSSCRTCTARSSTSPTRSSQMTRSGGRSAATLDRAARCSRCSGCSAGTRAADRLGVWIVLVLARMYGADSAARTRVRPPAGDVPRRVLPLRNAVARACDRRARALGLDDLARAPEPRRRIASRRRRVARGRGGRRDRVAVADRPARSVVQPTPVLRVAVAWGALVVLVVAAAAALRSARARVRLLSVVLALDALALFVVPGSRHQGRCPSTLLLFVYLRSQIGG